MPFFATLINWWKIALGALVASIPIIAYIFGRKDASHKSDLNQAKDAAKAEKDISDFTIRMERANNEASSNRPESDDALVDRLRKSGL